MKAITKLLADFVTWRWAPTVGLLSAALLYVLVVVGMIPTEIGVPVANAKFAPRSLSTSTLGEAASTAVANTSETEAPAAQPHAATAHTPRAPAEFGRRGFSPPIERPEPPAPPPTPVIPPPPPVAVAAAPEVASAPPPAATAPAPPSFGAPLGGRLSGMFQGLSGAMRNRIPPANAQAPAETPPQQAPAADGQTPAGGQAQPGQPPPGQPPQLGAPSDGEAKPVPPPQ